MDNILQGKTKPLYFKYLIAASGSAMVSCIFGTVDGIMIGRYHGPSGSAVIAVFNPLWGFIFCLALLSGIGGSVLFANHRGKGDEKSAQQFFTLSLVFGAILSVIAMLAIGIFRDPLFKLFGADEELLHLCKLYLRPILYSVPSCIFNTIISAYLRNDDNPNLATVAVIIGGVFNCFGDYFFIFTLDMGIYGAGLATAIGQFIPLLIMLTHFLSKKNTLRVVKPEKPFNKLGAITLNGFSTAINDFAIGIISILFNRQIMKHLGTDALAVYGVLACITAFAQCLAYGTGQAAQPLISQNFGARNYGRIRKFLKYGVFTCVIMGIFWILVTLLFPNARVHLFMKPTEEVIRIAPAILRIYGISYLLLPFNIFATYYFQSIMKPRISTAASVMRGIVISGVLVMVLPMIFEASSIWYTMLVTEIIVAVFSIVYMRKCNTELY
ncbi:MAG: MATE family efflux transporter [Clostridia bacterium]|nr:MATE family efflux transporter [Clostridia bacterium]